MNDPISSILNQGGLTDTLRRAEAQSLDASPPRSEPSAMRGAPAAPVRRMPERRFGDPLASATNHDLVRAVQDRVFTRGRVAATNTNRLKS